MGENNKIVARFKDGKVAKGYLRDFSIGADTIVLELSTTQQELKVPVEELKAIYYVKTFEGSRKYIEKKAFGIRKHAGRKAYIKFNDKESLVGFIEGEVPWDKGFSLAKLGDKAKGFFLAPVDGDSNNIKVFVVGSAIQDITIMMV